MAAPVDQLSAQGYDIREAFSPLLFVNVILICISSEFGLLFSSPRLR